MNYSLTYLGALATMIASLGLMSEADALSFLNALLVVTTTLITLYGRWRKGDVSLWGAK